MTRLFLRGIVRNSGKGRQGVGVEMFRLDAAEDSDVTLTESEAEESEDAPKSSTAIIRIYEDIGEDFWTGQGITAKSFSKQLDDLGDIKRINLHINSLGGDAFAAQAIHSIIADHSANTKAYIDGVAASAATIIACGADQVIARHNTNYMVHYPWAVSVGNAEVMRKAADDLEKLTVPIVSVYKEQVKGKIDEDTIRDLMASETWMTADEAFENGFVDKVRGRIKAIAKVSNSQILCSGQLLNFAKYHYTNMPDYPKTVVKVLEKKKEAIKEEPMTIEELRENHPEIYAAVRTEATQSERVRLATLDGMSAPGLEEIINKAKVDGKQPSDIVMECFNVTKTNLLQSANVQRLTKDSAAANQVPAGEAPAGKPESKKDKGVKLLTAAQTTLRERSRFSFNGNGGQRNN